MSNEQQTITCQCGSVVKATNVRAHERTKRHQNFIGANVSQAVRGQKPLPPPPQRGKSGVGSAKRGVGSAKRGVGSHQDEIEQDELSQEDALELEDDYDSQEDGDDIGDEIGDEDDELILAVEHLLQGQNQISEQVQNLHSSVPLSFESLRKRLDEVESNVLKSIKDFVEMYNENTRKAQCGVKPSEYINDKCSLRD